MRILIVDDDRIIRDLIRKFLGGEFGAEVIEAENGFKALEILKVVPYPDLAVVDMMMPGLDGIQLLEKIRSIFSLRRMKIIMCSSLNERFLIAQAYALEIHDYIVKPIQREKLVKSVKIALRLGANYAPKTLSNTPNQTDLQEYVNQLTSFAQQTDNHILMIRKGFLIGDRSSVAETLREISQNANTLCVSRIELLAGKLESQIFHCSEETMTKDVQLLADELILLRKNFSLVPHV
jgi:CheY-like chemotaxis protein